MIAFRTQVLLAFIRGVLVAITLFLFGKPINRYADSVLSKNKIFGKMAKKDKKLRELMIRKYWVVGLLVTAINLLILFLFRKHWEKIY